ncbi:hypothetical protein A3Q56_04735 [Intoshia linei]|uniref:Kinesin-like protein Kif23 Arf6-interacting domain-containing protein n=1 Tax=Intoshia linei TaxID=1819745 RepID=A0A177B1N3_9BILA|nr:hypothetical protein A3Q56_04735 [Intoshia linei]
MKKRRSRSADLWIDHDDSPTKRMLDFQLVPKMKKSITRSHITVADTKIASKYLLTHEGTDTDGEISRKIITGSIKPTNCGGSTVVFEQMNKITSESPGSKHIRFKGDLQPTEFDGQWTDTEDRCHIAVEGHGI